MSDQKQIPMIYKKLIEVMKDIGYIGKGQVNAQQGFKFRGIDDVMNTLYPALTKHGVFIAPRVLERKEEIRTVLRSNGKQGVDKHVSVTMSYTFYAEDGSNVAIATVGEGVDSGDKATNKALSSAFKYALLQAFSIPTMDMEESDKTTIELGQDIEKVSEFSVSKNTENLAPSSDTNKQTSANNSKTGFKRPVKKLVDSNQMSDDVW